MIIGDVYRKTGILTPTLTLRTMIGRMPKKEVESGVPRELHSSGESIQSSCVL
jgi:hypothetical protein